MSGTAWPGVTDEDLGWDLAAPFVGQNPNGVGGSVFNQWTEGTSRGPNLVLNPPEFVGAGAVIAAGEINPASAAVEHFGSSDSDAAGLGELFYERVHIVPKGKVDFGNIVSTVESDYEIYSAHRRDSVTLTSIVNNASPGVEFPDLTPPVVIPPQTSVLDPDTTGQTTGALGTIVLLKVRALADGLPSFDTNVDFLTSSNTVFLLLKGNRIVLVSVEPSGGASGPVQGAGGYSEILEFSTDILPARAGKEQRISNRDQPRQIIEWEFLVDELDRQFMQSVMFDWQSKVFAVPVWWEQVAVTASIAADTTDTVSVQDLTYVDMRVGELAVVFRDRRVFDVLAVASKTANSVTFVSNIQNSYEPGDRVVPVRLCHAQSRIQGRRSPVKLERLAIQFRCISNSIDPPTPSGAAFSSYLGKVLLDDCNLMQGDVPEFLERRIYVTDNQTGLVTQVSPWEHGKRGHTKGFLVKSRQQLFELRQLLYLLRGRQVSLWIPTFIEDLTPSQDLTISLDTMDIENVGYTRFAQSRHPKKTLRITFTDGTSLIRIVQSSVELSVDEERLTLDTTWPATKTVDEVQRIEFLELVRFDTDQLRIQHSTIVGRAKLFAPVKTVNDLD